MPFIRVTTPADLFTAEQRKQVADRLTVEIMKIETGGHDTPGFRAISALVFDDIAPQRWSIGGVLGEEPAAVVEIRVPQGALDDDRRRQMAEASYRVLAEANPELAAVDGVRRVWTHMVEIADGNWGAGGRIVRLDDVRRVAANEALTAAE